MNLNELGIKVTFWLFLALFFWIQFESFVVRKFKRPESEKPKQETSYLYNRGIKQLSTIR